MEDNKKDLPAGVPEERRCEACGRRTVDHTNAEMASSAEFTGPGGFSGRVTGSVAVIVVCAVAIVIAAMYFLRQHDDAMKDYFMKIESSMAKTARIQEGVIYVLTKKQDDREALNLGKPDIIREMENRRQP